MYWSAAEVALVPAGVVTVTSTVPVPAGAVTWIVVSDDTENSAAEVVPNETAVAPAKPLPVMVASVPPSVEPVVGLRPVTFRAGTL